MSYDLFSPSCVQYLATTTTISEPHSYSQAVINDNWCKEILTEITALEANHTWDVVPLPPNKKVVGCKWLYKVKFISLMVQL